MADRAIKTDCRIEFGTPQTAPIRRVARVLLQAGIFPSPVHRSTLPLHVDLFMDGAVIFESIGLGGEHRDAGALASSTALEGGSELRYLDREGNGIGMSLRGFEQLAIWSPTDGADLPCIEPWFGLPAPVGLDGEYVNKHHQSELAPGDPVRSSSGSRFRCWGVVCPIGARPSRQGGRWWSRGCGFVAAEAAANPIRKNDRRLRV